MQLLTDAIRKMLPRIYANEGKPETEQTVVCKFFTPWAGWTWYVLEFDGEDEFFGLVDGLEAELGYFSLAELEEVRGPFGLTVERDIHWQPTPLSQVHAQLLEQ